MRRIHIALLILALGGLPAVAGPALGILEPVEVQDRGPNAPPAALERSDFSFSLSSGDTYENSSSLGALAPGDFDTYLVTITETVNVELELTDCCETGDSLCFARLNPLGNPICATSPATNVRVFNDVPPGTYRLGVGYSQPHSGVFPSGYTLRATAFQGACDIDVCGTYEFGCGGNPSCVCYGSSEGEGFCGTDQSCDGTQACSSSAECPSGFFCTPDTCCGGPICLAADCSTESDPFTSEPIMGPSTIHP